MSHILRLSILLFAMNTTPTHSEEMWDGYMRVSIINSLSVKENAIYASKIIKIRAPLSELSHIRNLIGTVFARHIKESHPDVSKKLLADNIKPHFTSKDFKTDKMSIDTVINRYKLGSCRELLDGRCLKPNYVVIDDFNFDEYIENGIVNTEKLQKKSNMLRFESF
jgi:hypothetical protein